MRRSMSVLLVVAASATLLSGCGGSSAKSVDSVTLTPRQIVLAAQAATEASGSAKLGLVVNTSIEGGQSLAINGNGAFDFVKKQGTVHTSFPNPAGGGDLSIDVVITGTTLYIKSEAFAAFAGKPWLSIDLGKALGGSFSQLGSSDPSQGLSFLQGTKDVTLVGKEDVRGAASTHYAVKVDLTAAAAKLTGTAKTGVMKLQKSIKDPTNVPLDVWVDKDNRATRTKMTITTKATAATEGKSATTTVTTEFFDFGSKVTVVIPPASDVADGSKILGGSRG